MPLDSCEKHIIPDLGHIEIVKLTTGDVRRWHLTMLKKPSARTPRKLRPGEAELPPPPLLKSRTVVIHHSTLRKALADAVADEAGGLKSPRG